MSHFFINIQLSMCRYPDRLMGIVLTELCAVYREKSMDYTNVVLLIELYKYRESIMYKHKPLPRINQKDQGKKPFQSTEKHLYEYTFLVLVLQFASGTRNQQSALINMKPKELSSFSYSYVLSKLYIPLLLRELNREGRLHHHRMEQQVHSPS